MQYRVGAIGTLERGQEAAKLKPLILSTRVFEEPAGLVKSSATSLARHCKDEHVGFLAYGLAKQARYFTMDPEC